MFGNGPLQTDEKYILTIKKPLSNTDDKSKSSTFLIYWGSHFLD